MASVEEVRVGINHAFKDVRLEDGISLKQAEVIDEYNSTMSAKDFADLKAGEECGDWRAIPLETLEAYGFIAHLDAKGLRYYIPALMLSVLEQYDPSSMRVIGTLSALYPKKDLWDYHVQRYSLLDEAQKGAIASFLQALPDMIKLDHEDSKIVPRALRNYWGQFLPD